MMMMMMMMMMYLRGEGTCIYRGKRRDGTITQSPSDRHTDRQADRPGKKYNDGNPFTTTPAVVLRGGVRMDDGKEGKEGNDCYGKGDCYAQ